MYDILPILANQSKFQSCPRKRAIPATSSHEMIRFLFNNVLEDETHDIWIEPVDWK
jgi:hypothetical protein